MKKFTLLSLFLLGLALVLACTGCTTATSTDTTTTTNSTTSTTVPGSASVSGTVTLPGLAGNLWVGITTVSTTVTTENWVEANYLVTAADTSKNYSLSISTPGTYYVIAWLSVGATGPTSSLPVAGDRLGEYSDGSVHPDWGQGTTGTPTAIVVTSGAAETGKDFALNVTWK
jgi:hypothetical protein